MFHLVFHSYAAHHGIEHCSHDTAHLLDNEEDPEACHDDDEEGEEEPSSEEIDVIREVLGILPCRSTVIPLSSIEKVPQPRKGGRAMRKLQIQDSITRRIAAALLYRVKRPW